MTNWWVSAIFPDFRDSRNRWVSVIDLLRPQPRTLRSYARASVAAQPVQPARARQLRATPRPGHCNDSRKLQLPGGGWGGRSCRMRDARGFFGALRRIGGRRVAQGNPSMRRSSRLNGMTGWGRLVGAPSLFPGTGTPGRPGYGTDRHAPRLGLRKAILPRGQPVLNRWVSAIP